MGIPILHLMPAFPKNPCTELQRQGFSPLAALTPNTVFAGKITLFLSNWKAITKDHWVLQTVSEGYHIPLRATPVQMIPPYNPHYSEREQTLLKEELEALLTKQAVQRVPTSQKGFYSNMFMVPKKDGGQRPVINLKALNTYVKTEHFKMEGLHTVKALLQKEDWMTKIDLKDAFFMIPMAPQFRHLLLFKLNAESFQFKCLPFGLCTAPRVFTKTLKPAIELLRGLGIQMVIYMDNMLLMASSKQSIQEHTHITIFVLENLGFIINNKKSLLDPSQEIEFLGMVVNSQSMDLKLPGEKIKKIRLEARNILDTASPSAKTLAQLLGKLNATTPALQAAPLFSRALQMCLRESLSSGGQNYQSVVTLSPQAREDLHWWEQHLTSWNGRSLILPPSTLTIISDASQQGWGATCEGVTTRGPWSPHEKTLHINCLELLAATLAVQTFAKQKQGISILLKIDNTTAVAYISRRGGTISPLLSQLAKDLWLWCMNRNIYLQAQHLPGKMNTIADRESRSWSDRSEWKLSPRIFQRINAHLGPLLTDLFASRLSKQLPTFVSWRPDPLAIAADAFTLDWHSLPQKLYANPPWNLIGRVLSYIILQELQEVILVAPVWRAQPWYPLLLHRLVKIPLLIHHSPEVIQSTCHNPLPDIIPQLAVWVISGRDAEVANFQKQLPTLSCHHGERSPLSHTILASKGGQAGVVNGTEIPFADL